MSLLPQSWTATNLGAICAKGQYGWTTKSTDRGSVRFLRTTDITKGPIDWSTVPYCLEVPSDLDKYLIKPNDLLISRAGSVGYSILIQEIPYPTVFASYLIRFIPSENVNPKFIAYFLKTADYWQQIGAAAAGIALANVNAAKLSAVEMPLAPYNEQKHIVEKLDSIFKRADSCREHLDRVPGILDRLRQSIMTIAISGKLTEEWRIQHNAQPWHDTTIGAVCKQSFYGPRFGRNEYSRTGIPTIRTTDMTADGRIEITDDTPRVQVPEDKITNFRVEKGDLLITRTGSIGVMAVFDDDYVAIPSAYLIRFRFTDAVVPRFMFFCLMSPTGQNALGLSATAITQPNINAEAIKRIKVRLPGVEEQHEIVRRIDALFTYVDRLKTRYLAAQAAVEQLSSAVLRKAFNGELVPQDPNDQPAAVLIERIRAEKITREKRAKEEAYSAADTAIEKIKVIKRTPMKTNPIKTLEELSELLKKMGGKASPDQLIVEASLEDDVDTYFELLREGRDKGLLEVPVGRTGMIRRTAHANR